MSTRRLCDGVLERTLPNGLRVLLKPDDGNPIVAVNVWFGVGSVHESEEINGLAHFQEHMVFKGTERFGVGEIPRLVRGVGGNLNAGTSYSYTMYYVVVPCEAFDTALDVQADAMMHSTFDPGEFAREREVVIDEARMYDDRPESFTFYRTMELAFTRHTYRRPIAGYPRIVERITRDQLVAFYRNWYRPSNAVLVVVGDVDPDAAFERIARTYGDWEDAPVERREPPEEPPQDGPRFRALTGAIDHGYLGAAFHVPDIVHADAPALEMLAELLGSGRSARLRRRLVEREPIATSVSASLLAERWPGVFLLSASMEPSRWDAVRDAMLEEIERFKHEPVPEAELEKARRQLERDLAGELETVEGQASTLGYYALLGDHRLADRHHEAIRAVGADDVARVARRYFHPDNLSLVGYLPESAARPDDDAVIEAVRGVLGGEGGVREMGRGEPGRAVSGAEGAGADGAGAERRRPRAVSIDHRGADVRV